MRSVLETPAPAHAQLGDGPQTAPKDDAVRDSEAQQITRHTHGLSAPRRRNSTPGLPESCTLAVSSGVRLEGASEAWKDKAEAPARRSRADLAVCFGRDLELRQASWIPNGPNSFGSMRKPKSAPSAKAVPVAQGVGKAHH